MRNALLTVSLIASAHASAAPNGGDITTYADLASFLAATSTMTLSFEDFSAHDSFNVSPCYEPVNRDAGQPATSFLAPTCFYPGDVISGFSIRSDLDWTSGITSPWGPMTGPGLFFVGANTQTPTLPSNAVGATYSAATKTLIDFHDGPVAIAIDAYDVAAGSPITVDVYDGGGSMTGSFTVMPGAPTSPAFAGFTSTTPIARVVLHSASAVSQMFGNLRFGGSAGKLVADTDYLEFQAVPTGSILLAPINFTNSGYTTVTIDPIAEPGDPFSLNTENCSGTTLAPGATCTMSVEFSPMLERAYSGVVTVFGNGVPNEIGLHGRGVLRTLDAAPGRLDFGVVNPGETGGPLTLTLANTSAVAVTVNAITLPGAPFSSTGGTCGDAPFGLGRGESCTLSFSFAPTANGRFTDRVVIASNSPSTPSVVLISGAAGDTIFADGFDPP